MLDQRNKRELEPHSLLRMGIPRRYWPLQREQFQSRIYYKQMHDFIVGMKAVREEGRSLFIYGPSGSGKSALAAYIARVYAEYGTGVCFASASSIHQEIEQRIFDSTDEVSMEKFYREVELLVVDGLGLELAIARRGSLITQLYEDRFQAVLPTIFTCSISDISELDAMALYPGFFKHKLVESCICIKTRV